MVRVIARILWVVPFGLVLLSIDQAKLAYDLRTTWHHGAQTTAEVLEWQSSNRADVTYGYVSLRIPLADGSTLTRQKLSLPNSLLSQLEGVSTLAVHVRPGASQEIVIDRIMPTHWHIAAAQVGISLLGAVIFFAGAYWWNGYLRKEAGLRWSSE